jgi:hypothetical protein
MIIGYLNIIGIRLLPSKTYPPLIVNSDAMLPLAIARELLQSIAWWYPQIFQSFRGI